MSGTPKVCVVLSGCGVFDGTEISEAVVTLLTLSRARADVQCAAPDRPQHHVVDHLRGQVVEGARRDVLVESARIARGAIRPLSEIDAGEFDALFFPGGFGAAKNLTTFALEGAACDIDPDVTRVVRDFHAQGKPIGAVCIAPAVLARALGKGTLTIGEDAGAAAGLQGLGATHETCPVTDLVVDADNRLVTSPAYMYDAPLRDVATGIEKAVLAVLEMIA